VPSLRTRVYLLAIFWPIAISLKELDSKIGFFRDVYFVFHLIFCFLFDKSRKRHPIAVNSIPLVYKCCTISMPNINQIRAFLNFLEIKIKVAGFDIPRL
jgi:hypothetical protein